MTPPSNAPGSAFILFAFVATFVVLIQILKGRRGRRSRGEVTLGEPQRLTPEVFEQLLEEEKRMEAARYPDFPYRFSVTIFAPIGPIERGEKFENPLMRALGDFGVVLGGGTVMTEIDGKQVITDTGFSVRAKELEKGLAILRKTLLEQGAPHTTLIRLTLPNEAEYRLND